MYKKVYLESTFIEHGKIEMVQLKIDKWSAGCQVFSKESDFNEFMDVCRKASDVWGNSFTYTLIESKDIS